MTQAPSPSLSHRYYALAGQHVGTCEQLGWDALAILPMLAASSDDADEALARGIAALGHDDVTVYDSEACEIVGADEGR